MNKKTILGVAFASLALIGVSATEMVLNESTTIDNSIIEPDSAKSDGERMLKRIEELKTKNDLSNKEKAELKKLEEDFNTMCEIIGEIAGAPTGPIQEAGIAEEFSEDQAPAAPKGKPLPEGADVSMAKFTLQVNGKQKVFNVADVNDEAHIYGDCKNKKNTWVVISKKEFRVYVYEAVGADTLLRATFPVCYARNAQDKTRTGDSCTPECRDSKTPFTISQIQDASTWRHTFANDPRGNILAYGPYFMRLKLTGSKVPNNNSIGIHGCGGYEGKSNSYSVPGRDSEGCLRLRDNDLRTLRTKYCDVGTKVFIKPATGKAGNKYPYEVKAMKACKGYVPATIGNPLSGKVKNL